jgi:hypothetical protein
MMSLMKCATLILGTTILTGCAQKLTHKETNGADAYCAGRYLVEGPSDMRIDGSRFSYYWGDIETWSESSSAYTERLARAQRAAEDTGKLSRPIVRTNENSGMLMFTHEEDAPPFDPNTTLLQGYAHRDGVTVEFKKRTVNRLLDVAQLRTREIIGALQPRPPRLASISSESFCAGDGVITLAPQAEWYEATAINGTFSVSGHKYKFLFSVHPLKSPELNQNDLSGRRETVADMAGAKQVQGEHEPTNAETRPVIVPKHGAMHLLSAENSEGRKFVIYEWRGASSSAPNNVMVPYLYIWSVADTADDRSDAQLVKAAHDSPTDMPLYVRFVQLAQTRGAVTVSAPVQEESRVPYSKRLTYPDGTESAQGVRYSVFRNSELVAEGRSDKNGFTEALNADYLETWEIKAYR